MLCVPLTDSARVSLSDVLAAQDGLVTRAQATEAGMSPAAIRHAIRPGGPWRRLAPGLYASFTGQLTPRQRLRAVLLHAGDGAVLSGADAAAAYDLRYVPEQRRPLVLVPSRTRVESTQFVTIRRVRDLPEPRLLANLPVAPVERAVIDCCLPDPALFVRPQTLQDVRAIVCESVQRRITTPERLADAAARLRRNGTRLLRMAVADVGAGCWSAPECEFRDLVRTSRVLPEPRWNEPLPDLPQITPDGWWDEARLVAEIDSAEHHHLGLTPEQTQERHAQMVAAGWTVLSLAPTQIRRRPAYVLLLVESAFRAGVSRSVGHHLGRR